MTTRIAKIIVIISLFFLWPYQQLATGAKPFSVASIVRLLQDLKVSPQKIAEEVRKQGVNFEVSDAIRTQLRNAGADEGLLLAIERESMAYARKALDDARREIEEAKKRAADDAKAEAKRQQAAIEAQRKADEEARRKEEARLQAEERERQRVAERKAREEADRQEAERKRAEEERKKAEEDRNRTDEMVSVGSFKIDKTEVTVTAYQRCVGAGQCTVPNTGGNCNWNVSGRGNHPINCVDWEQADTYCKWAGKRLPTEVEWEKAARGTDSREYPWGNEWDATKANVGGSVDGYEQTAPVGSFPTGASPYVVLDMAGNVREWMADWYDGEQQYRSLRGGSWLNLPLFARASNRSRHEPGHRLDFLGFRCAQ